VKDLIGWWLPGKVEVDKLKDNFPLHALIDDL
jgi:hypothetical protein